MFVGGGVVIERATFCGRSGVAARLLTVGSVERIYFTSLSLEHRISYNNFRKKWNKFNNMYEKGEKE